MVVPEFCNYSTLCQGKTDWPVHFLHKSRTSRIRSDTLGPTLQKCRSYICFSVVGKDEDEFLRKTSYNVLVTTARKVDVRTSTTFFKIKDASQRGSRGSGWLTHFFKTDFQLAHKVAQIDISCFASRCICFSSFQSFCAGDTRMRRISGCVAESLFTHHASILLIPN